MLKLQHAFQFSNPETLIRKFIDIYTCMSAQSGQWLTPREKDLFVQYVLLFNEGKDLSSKATCEELCIRSQMKKNTKSFYIYRAKLIDKGWIALKDSCIHIPSIFQFKNNIPNMSVDLKFILNG